MKCDRCGLEGAYQFGQRAFCEPCTGKSIILNIDQYGNIINMTAYKQPISKSGWATPSLNRKTNKVEELKSE